MTATLPTDTLLGYPVHLVSMDQAITFAHQSILSGVPCHVATLNPEMIMQANTDPALESILKSSQLNLPDGAGAVWALHHKGHKYIHRLPGIEFSERLLFLAATENLRVALLGAKPETLTLAAQNLQSRYPTLNIVFQHHGYFTCDEDAHQQALACIHSKPHIVLVALGVPKQEKWIAQYKDQFQGTALVGVGGSFDVWSGLTNRAPKLFRQLNLEWLYRITSEPWRLKRVYKTLPLFVLKVLQNERAA